MSESGTAAGQVLAMRLRLDLFSVAVRVDEKCGCKWYVWTSAWEKCSDVSKKTGWEWQQQGV